MANIPQEMRALVLPTYSKPSEYNVATIATPKITKPDELLIKMHGASINPVDVKIAAGMMKMIMPLSFPAKVGEDGAGTVVAVGEGVKAFKVGDEVYTRVPASGYTGTIAEYALSTEAATALKPKTLNLTEAASIPLVALTSYQALQEADSRLEGGLKGKTVFVPAGLSGTGLVAVQLAKNVFGAGKVITSLSTGKIEGKKYEAYIGANVVDQVVDYRTQNVVETIGKGTVDFFYDTVGSASGYAPIMKKGGTVISIATVPSGKSIKAFSPNLSFFIATLLDLADWFFSWRVGRHGASYSYLFMHPDKQALEELAGFIDEGKLKTVVGRTTKLEDVEGLRAGAQEVYDAKGGVGKFVIKI